MEKTRKDDRTKEKRRGEEERRAGGGGEGEEGKWDGQMLPGCP